MLVSVFDRGSLDAREERLTRPERLALDRARFGPRRRAEWIAGRVAARRALTGWLGDAARALSIVSAPDGAPTIPERPDLSISLSHDEAWMAVATAHRPARVSVDLCDRRHDDRARALLDRLSVDGGTGASLSPAAAWAALECTLKLRGLGIAALLDARPTLAPAGAGAVRVSGLGARAVVSFSEAPDFALAWAEET